MAIKLICTEDAGEFTRGQEVIGDEAIAAARAAHPHNFVAVAIPDAEPAPATAEAEQPAT